MREEIKKFNREEIFKNYHSKTNPFLYLTTKIEVTKLYRKCRENNKTYATVGYYITKAMNRVDAFKYRYEEDKFYKYQELKPNFTQMIDENKIGYFTCNMKDNLEEFIEEYKKVQNNFNQGIDDQLNLDQGEVWLSCVPWFNFTGLVTPFDKKITVPQILWDRFYLENGKWYINMMIMVHHGFADGYHIGKFIEKLNEEIDNIE